jgi:hypothetical protein
MDQRELPAFAVGGGAMARGPIGVRAPAVGGERAKKPETKYKI